MIVEKELQSLINQKNIVWMIDNQGRRVQREIKTSERGNVIFVPVIEECDRSE